MAVGTPSAWVGDRVRAGWGRYRPRLRVSLTPWTVATLAAVALVLLPIASIFVGILGESSDTWRHLAATVLWDYLRNSGLLVVGVGGLTLVIGVATAWLVTTCDFPGRRTFAWALILPLSVPTYIMAYTYAELLGHTGPLAVVLDPAATAGLRSALMSLPGAGLVLALALYPYVYLITRTSFLKQSGAILESARILGKSSWQTFSQVALPMARPAVVAGVILVRTRSPNEDPAFLRVLATVVREHLTERGWMRA
jgi:iron(III) transport system permease protein